MNSIKNNNKRIDVIVKYFYPVAAGIENNIMQTYSHLVKRGWQIVVHTSKDTYNEKNVLKEKEEISGIIIKRYPWKSYFGFWPNINWQSAQHVCLHNFNIVPHLLIMFYALAQKILGKKKYSLFIIPHGGYSPEWRTFSTLARIVKRAYHQTLAVLMINLTVDGIRAVAYWEKEDMIRSGIKENIIKVITNGLEDEAYSDIENKASEEAKEKVRLLGDYIIQGGRIYEIKNQLTTIKAMSLIDSNLKFVMLGPCQDKAYKEMLMRKISELGLMDRVVFLGVVRGIDKYYYLKHAKAMVHMALWEGNCNFIHEAWSQRLICIVADSLGLNEQITDQVNGFLVGEKDVKKLSEWIKYVIDNQNSEKLNKMRQKNLEYVDNNSWQHVASRVKDFYLEKTR